MTAVTEILLAFFLLAVLWLAAASRLLHCIRLAAYQGVIIGLFPLAVWNWSVSAPGFGVIALSFASLAVKGLLLPYLLRRAMYKAEVKRELEPFVGYSFSLLIVLGVSACAFYLCDKFRIAPPGAPMLGAPAAFTAMFTGLFIIIARRKAITQAIGFLVFENGITIFGLGMTLEYGLLVELGILLDVFVLIFVMGIAVFHIRSEFSHIDSDRMNLLGDNPSTTEVTE